MIERHSKNAFYEIMKIKVSARSFFFITFWATSEILFGFFSFFFFLSFPSRYAMTGNVKGKMLLRNHAPVVKCNTFINLDSEGEGNQKLRNGDNRRDSRKPRKNDARAGIESDSRERAALSFPPPIRIAIFPNGSLIRES